MLNIIRTTVSAVVVTLLAAFSSLSSAAVLEVDTGWSTFCGTTFLGSDSGATSSCFLDFGYDTIGNTIELDLDSSAYLQVTDFGLPGDVFDVYINSVLAFTTSAPGVGLPIFDPEAAFASSVISSGSILLEAGLYSIDIFANSAPFLAYQGLIQAVSAAVPAPSVLALMLLGLLVTRAMSRRTS